MSSFVKQLPGCKNDTETDVLQWVKNYEPFVVTGDSFIETVSELIRECKEKDLADTVPMMIHSKRFGVLGAAMRYVEQKPETH